MSERRRITIYREDSNWDRVVMSLGIPLKDTADMGINRIELNIAGYSSYRGVNCLRTESFTKGVA